MTKYKSDNFLDSLMFARRGVFLAIKSQRNFKIDLFFAVVALAGAYYFKFSPIELAILILTIGLMLFAELTNTVLEFILDAYFGNKFSNLAGMAKDIAAGAVLITAIISVSIGVILFGNKIWI